jgi:hypothetical protein
MSHQTHDEARADYTQRLASLHPDLGAVFHSLVNEYWWIQTRWAYLHALFARSQARVDTLNEVAGPFFKAVQDDFWDATLLHLCRMTDPARGGRGHKHRQLSLYLLAELWPGSADRRFKRLLHEASSATAFARQIRDGHIAHRSLAIALDASPLTAGSIHDIERAADAILAVLNFFARVTMDTQIGFVDSSAPHAEHLLRVIREGLDAYQVRRAARDYSEIDID